MNALELADDLEGAKLVILRLNDMLLQQQAEIDDLKAKLQLHEAMDNQCASLMQQFRKAQEK